MDQLQYAHDHGCDTRACPARAVVRLVFIRGEVRLCSHHDNENSVGPGTFGFVKREDIEEAAKNLGAPPYRGSKARKIEPPARPRQPFRQRGV